MRVGVVVWGACISPQKAWSWLLGWAAAWRVLVYLWFVTEMSHRISHLFTPPCCDALIDQPGAINL